jgi:MGT family glycosyltransferase
MARFVIGTVPFAGHTGPVLPVARALVERGHDVRWYASARLRATVEATGARHVPMSPAADLDEETLVARFPETASFSGLRRLKRDLKHVFIDAAAGQVHDLQRALAAEPADVLLADSAFAGARLVHELGGPPWAVLNPLPVTLSSRDTAPFGLGIGPSATPLGHLRNTALRWLFGRVLFRDTIEYLDNVRASLGLPPTGEFIMDAARSPYLYLQATVPAFEYPRSDLPPQVHFIGPSLPPRPESFTPPAWWPELKDARRMGPAVVHVTQGTVATDPSQLLIPTIKALAAEDVLVVATTGGKPVASLGPGTLPANVRVAPFIPHAYLLPYVDVMVTNGGYNGVQIALANGVPLVAAGATEDKPEVCARIAWSGAGVDLRRAAPSAAQVRDAVRTVLTDPSYRERARQLANQFAAHDAPQEAAALLERLAATRAPVLRPARSRPAAGALPAASWPQSLPAAIPRRALALVDS